MSRRDAAPAWSATVCGVMWLALFPLWQDGSYSRITHSKWVGMIVLTCLTALMTLRALVQARTDGSLRRPSPAILPALAYFLLVACSARFGALADSLNDAGQRTVLHGAVRYEGLWTQMCYAAVFLCMSLLRPNVRRVLDGAADGLLLFCGIAGLQHLGINVLGLYPAGRSIHTNYEFQGTIGNIDMVSGYVSLVMPALLCGFTLAEKRPAWLLSGLCGAALMCFMGVQSGLIVTGLTALALVLLALRMPRIRSRTAFALAGMLTALALRRFVRLPWLDGTAEVSLAFSWSGLALVLAGMLLLGVAWLLRRWPGPALSRRGVLGLLTVLAVAALLAVYLLPIPAGNGLWELREILHGRPQDAFGSERIGVWRLTLQMSSESLLFGTGPDTFLQAMESYMSRTGQRLVQRFDNPHNIFLAILANNGLPALLAFLGLCGTAVYQVLRRGVRDSRCLPLLLGCCCYLLQGMFTFTLCVVTPMFYAMLGMLCASSGESLGKEEPAL